MKNYELLQLAAEAGLTYAPNTKWVVGSLEGLERFAAIVAAAEREECAKVCEERIEYWYKDDGRRLENDICAALIRVRGEK